MVYNQNPQFLDSQNKDFRLTCYSPAINTGNPGSTVLTDIDDFPRIGLTDAGAYEFKPVQISQNTPGGSNVTLSGVALEVSASILNTSNVLYQGYQNVQLLPGFKVAPLPSQATVFKAEVDTSCP